MKKVYKISEDMYHAKYYKIPYDGYIDEYDLENLAKEYNCNGIEKTPRIITLEEKISDVNISIKDLLKDSLEKLVIEIIELGDSKKWWINSNNKRVSYNICVNNFGVSIKFCIHYSELKEYPKLMTSLSSKEISNLLSDVINKYIPDSKFVSFELI